MALKIYIFCVLLLIAFSILVPALVATWVVNPMTILVSLNTAAVLVLLWIVKNLFFVR